MIKPRFRSLSQFMRYKKHYYKTYYEPYLESVERDDSVSRMTRHVEYNDVFDHLIDWVPNFKDKSE